MAPPAGTPVVDGPPISVERVEMRDAEVGGARGVASWEDVGVAYLVMDQVFVGGGFQTGIGEIKKRNVN